MGEMAARPTLPKMDEVQFARQTVGCLGSEAVLLQDLVDDRQDLGSFWTPWITWDRPGSWALDSLRKTHELKEFGESGVGEVIPFHAIN